MTNEEKTGGQIHADIEHLRESGDFWGSIKLAQDAIQAYLQEKDYSGLSDIYGSISLAYRHLYRKTSDKNFLILAQAAAAGGIEIARFNSLDNALAMPMFDLAKVQEELGNLGEASEIYEDSIEKFQEVPQALHNRPGVLADMKIHLYTCRYRGGDKSALAKVLTAVEELEKSDEKTVSKYNYDVWLSGAHMRIAQMLKGDDKDLAKKHLDLAKGIIDANPDLKIRRDQLSELAKAI